MALGVVALLVMRFVAETFEIHPDGLEADIWLFALAALLAQTMREAIWAFRAQPVFASRRGIRFHTRRGWRSVRWRDVVAIEHRGFFLRFDRFIRLRLARGEEVELFASEDIHQILAECAPKRLFLGRDAIWWEMPEKLHSSLRRLEAFVTRRFRRAAAGRD